MPRVLAVVCFSLVVAGCSAHTPVAETAPPVEPAEPVESTEVAASLPHLTQDEAAAWLDEERSFVAIVSSTHCRPCGPYVERVASEQRELFGDVPVVVFHDFDHDWLDARLAGHHGWPTTVAFKRGVIVDKVTAALDTDGLRAFAARNLDGSSAERRTVETNLERTRFDLRRGALSGNVDLSGLALDGLELHGTDLSGADLRGASLRDAILHEVTLGHADLTGADLEGAQLHGVFWGESTCPDGTSSNAHGMTCEGHLGAETTSYDVETHRARWKACVELGKAATELADTEAAQQQTKLKWHFACAMTDHTGVELTATWQPVTLTELAPQLENAPAAPSLAWLENKACTVELLPARPDQRDAIDAFGVAFCGEDGTPLVFALGGPAE